MVRRKAAAAKVEHRLQRAQPQPQAWLEGAEARRGSRAAARAVRKVSPPARLSRPRTQARHGTAPLRWKRAACSVRGERKTEHTALFFCCLRCPPHLTASSPWYTRPPACMYPHRRTTAPRTARARVRARRATGASRDAHVRSWPRAATAPARPAHHPALLGSWVGVRCLLHLFLFLTASRMVLPQRS